MKTQTPPVGNHWSRGSILRQETPAVSWGMRPFVHSRQTSFSICVTERCNDPNPPPLLLQHLSESCQMSPLVCACLRARLHVRGQAYAGWIEAERLVIVARLRCRLQRSRPSAYSVLALNYKWPCDVLLLTDQSGWRLLKLSKHGRRAGSRRFSEKLYCLGLLQKNLTCLRQWWSTAF